MGLADLLLATISATVDVTRAATVFAMDIGSDYGSPMVARKQPVPYERNTSFDLSLAEDGLWEQNVSDQHAAEYNSPKSKFDSAFATLQEQVATDVSYGEQKMHGLLAQLDSAVDSAGRGPTSGT